MKYKILIVGAGQLGSRYLQGLFKTNFTVEIWTYDISLNSLERAISRFNEMGKSLNNVNYISSLESIPKEIDVAIISTTADIRVKTIEDIKIKTNVKFWILEKVLAQNQFQLLYLNKLLNNSKGVWVNTPMYLWPLYQEIRKLNFNKSPITAKFIDFNGLACNAIHYIDFVSRWNNAKILNYDISKLESNWVNSKREGFYEINGKLSFNFDDGSELILIGKENSIEYKVEIHIEDEIWFVNEIDGIAKSSKGNIINSPVLYQSQMTADLIYTILSNERPNLPTLAQSIEQHIVLLEALLNHWNQNNFQKIDLLPIT